MTWLNIIESTDWPVVVGFLCLELVLLWLKWIDEPLILPAPGETCIARGEPMHYVRTAEWDVGPGHARHVLSDDIDLTCDILTGDQE